MSNLRTDRARELRRHSTDAERTLWAVLRRRRVDGPKWRRQFPIGRYFADFACVSARLIVELDGSQHDDQAAYNAERTRVIESCGYRVLRFGNNDVLTNIDGVAETIHREILAARGGDPHPPARSAGGPLPLPSPGEGGR